MDNLFSVIDVARVELCCQGSYGEIGFIVLLVLLAESNAEQTLEVTWPGLIHGACKASNDFYRHFLKVITSLCQWNGLSGPLTSIQLLVESSKQYKPSDIPASSFHITNPVADWQAAASITYISNTTCPKGGSLETWAGFSKTAESAPDKWPCLRKAGWYPQPAFFL